MQILLVLRAHLSGEISFEELLRHIRKTALEAQTHQDMPFDLLVAELHPERDLSHQPLFQVMFALRNSSIPMPKFSGITAKSFDIHNNTAKFDLFLEMVDTADNLKGTLEYNTDLFNKNTIVGMAGHFQTLLKGISEMPATPISKLPLLTETEWHQLVIDWNDTAVDYPLEMCLHHLFETPG